MRISAGTSGSGSRSRSIYKFGDDQGNYLAALMTYYGFLSLFPLLLMASSILGFVLQDNPELQEKILDTALSQFPVIGDQLARPEGLQGSTTAIIDRRHRCRSTERSESRRRPRTR